MVRISGAVISIGIRSRADSNAGSICDDNRLHVTARSNQSLPTTGGAKLTISGNFGAGIFPRSAMFSSGLLSMIIATSSAGSSPRAS